MIRPRWRAAGIALVLAVSACSSLFVDAPRKLYRLSAQVSFPQKLPRLSGQIVVDLPNAPNALDTPRIALSRSPVSLDYFADAEWTDRTPRIVQGALIDAFEASGAVTAIDRDTLGLRADYAVTGELRQFEARYDSPAGAQEKTPQVAVGMVIRVVKLPDRTIVAQRGFEQHAAAASNDMQAIVLAFDSAMGALARDVVMWTVSNPALAAKEPLPRRR